MRWHKIFSLLLMASFFVISRYDLAKANDSAIRTPLINKALAPNGLVVPTTFLGVHLNRWSDDTTIGRGDLPMPGEVVLKNGTAYFISKNGYSFYYYHVGTKVKLSGVGVGGQDFETTLISVNSQSGKYPTVGRLADTPPKLGPSVIKNPTYVPTFGYSVVRSHDSGVNWASLNRADGVFNSELMNAWVQRHKDKKLMFTMSGTPEWLASSNISPISRSVSNGIVTLEHAALAYALPVGSRIKIRNCPNSAINGERVITYSTPTSTTFSANIEDESVISDKSTELLLWSNANGYGLMNPPKDFAKVNVFITWLMKNYGKNIDWIEGPNEANSGHGSDGKILFRQGQGLWWAGSFDQLGEMTRRINIAAKLVKPTVLIGSPSITGMHTGQAINQSPANRASSFQMLSAGDGAGGRFMDWVDFVPFHIYGYGQNSSQKFTGQMTGDEYNRLYENLDYIKAILAQPLINKPNIPIYMDEGGFGNEGPAKERFDAMTKKQQSNEIFRIAAIYAGFGVKGFFPYTNGFFGNFETQPHIAEAYNKINTRISGKTISPDSWINKETGAMYFKTTDGYEEYIP